MIQLVLMFHVVIAIAIVGLVLLQQGKGAGMGASFGSGSSQAVFGSRGPASFLMKLTGGLAMLFFATSLTLGYLSATELRSKDSFQVPVVQQQKSNSSKPIGRSTVPTLKQNGTKKSPHTEPKK